LTKIKITSFDHKISESFIQKIKTFGAHKAYIGHVQRQRKKNKYTILRSPHIFKKARDQIEIQHCSAFLNSRSKLFKIFLLIYKKYANHFTTISYKRHYEQDLFIT